MARKFEYGLIFVFMFMFCFSIYGQTFNEKREAIMKKYEELVQSGKMTREEADKKKAEELKILHQQDEKEMIKSKDVPMHLYGKVVDQNGDSVESVSITYSYWYYKPSAGPNNLFMDRKEEKILTSKDGLFEISARGMGLTINVLGKDGYDVKGMPHAHFDFEEDGTYRNSTLREEQFKSPDPNNPEIFVIRKKGEPTMLFTSGGTSSISFKRNEEAIYGISVIGPAGYNCRRYDGAQSYEGRIDLFVSAKLEEDAFNLTLKANGAKGSGIVVSEEKLYAAPDGEYKNEYSLKVTKQYDSFHPLYLYCRTGDPLVYSEIKLEVYASEDQFVVKFYTTCNPYGEKNLDHGRYLYSSSKIESLKDEAWKSLKEKKYPPKPDFKALEEEGKKEYLKKTKQSQ